jgi:hypothetical protein
MIPFKVDQSWYETYWYGDASLRHAGKRRPIRLKSIAAAAALLAASGSGAALAQGLPPGFDLYQSSWPNYVESHQAHAASVGGTITTHANGSASIARNNESASVADNIQHSGRKG